MVVKVYVSGISGNKEVKKRQQRVLMILDSKNIKYEVIDIAEPGKESDKDFMQNNSKSKGGTVSDPNPRSPLPPQIFNEEEYCGDYDQFDLANEVDTLEQFLKLELPEETPSTDEIVNNENTANGDVSNKEKSEERDSVERTQENADDNNKDTKDENVKDESEKEPSPERKMSVDAVTEENKEKSTDETDVELVEEKSVTKEEAINENGAVSSREVSEEKESQEVVEQKKDNPTEALLESEKAAASE